jgi:hypothetical protein
LPGKIFVRIFSIQNQRDTLKTVIKVMKQKIAQLIDQALQDQKKDVDNSFPSIFSREDVKHQLEEFGYGVITIIMEMKDEDKSSGLTFEQRQELEGLLRIAIEKKLDRMDSSDAIDYESAEFNIEYNNTLVLESININADSIADEIDDAISQVVGDFFQPIEEEVKEEVK